MDIEIDGKTYDIVPQDERLDPETEDLLYSDELCDEMRVLIESGLRSSEDMAHHIGTHLLVQNRWCRVTRLRMTTTETAFIGVYDDGDKQVRISSPTRGWVVKKDSVRPSESMSTYSGHSPLPVQTCTVRDDE